MTDPEELDDTPPGVSLSEAAGLGSNPERQYDIEPDELTRIPPQVEKYLKTDERNVICTRQHAGVLLLPAAVLMAGLAGAITGAVTVPAAAAHAIWWACLAAAAWAAYKWLEWRAGWFVITRDRLIVIQGLIRQRVDMLPYAKLRDLSMSQTIPGRVLGYGTFHCTSIGTDHALADVDRIPDPHGIYTRVCELIMPADGRRGPRR